MDKWSGVVKKWLDTLTPPRTPSATLIDHPAVSNILKLTSENDLQKFVTKYFPCCRLNVKKSPVLSATLLLIYVSFSGLDCFGDYIKKCFEMDGESQIELAEVLKFFKLCAFDELTVEDLQCGLPTNFQSPRACDTPTRLGETVYEGSPLQQVLQSPAETPRRGRAGKMCKFCKGGDKIRTLVRQASADEVEKNSLSEQIEKLTRELVDVRQKLVLETTRLNALKDDFSALRIERNDLRDSNESISRALSKLKDQNELLCEDIQFLRESDSSTSQQCEKLEAEKKNLEGEITSIVKAWKDDQQRCRALESRNQILEATASDQFLDLQELREMYAAVTAPHNESVAEVLDKSDHQPEIVQFREIVLSEEIGELKATIDSIKLEKESVEEEKEQIKNKLLATENVRKSLESTLKELAEELKKVSGNCEKLTEEKNDLTKSFADTLAELQEKLMKREMEVGSLNASRKVLSDKLSIMGDNRKKLENKIHELEEEMQTVVDKNNEEATSLLKEISLLKSSEEGLTAANHKIKCDLSENEQKIKQYASEKISFLEKIAALEASNQNLLGLEREISFRDETIQRMNGEKLNLLEKITTLESEKIAASEVSKQNLLRLEREISFRDETIQRMNGEKLNLLEKITTLESETISASEVSKQNLLGLEREISFRDESMQRMNGEKLNLLEKITTLESEKISASEVSKQNLLELEREISFRDETIQRMNGEKLNLLEKITTLESEKITASEVSKQNLLGLEREISFRDETIQRMNGEILNLLEKITTLESEKISLENEITIWTKKYSQLASEKELERAMFLENISCLERTKQELEEEVKVLVEKEKKQEGEIYNMEEVFNQVTDKNRQSVEEIASLSGAKRLLENQLKTLSKNHLVLENKMTENEEKLNKFYEERASFSEQICALNAAREDLERKLQDEIKRQNELSEDIVSVRKELEERDAKITELDLKNIELSDLINNKDMLIGVINAEAKAKLESLQSAVCEKELSLTSAQERIKDIRGSNTVLKEKLISNEKEIDQLESRNLHLQKISNVAFEKFRELMVMLEPNGKRTILEEEPVNVTCDQLSDEINTVIKSVSGLQSALHSCKRENEELEIQLDACKDSLILVSQEKEALRAKVVELSRDMKQLMRSLDESACEMSASDEDQLEAVSKLSNSIALFMENQRNKVSDITKASHNIRSELENLQSCNRRVLHLLNSLKPKVNVWKYTELKNSIAGSACSQSDVHSFIGICKLALTAAVDENSLDLDTRNVEVEVETLCQDVATAHTAFVYLLKTTDNLNALIESRSASYAKLEKDYESLEGRATYLTEINARLTVAISDTKYQSAVQLNEKKAELDSAIMSIDQMKKELQDLAKTNEKLREENKETKYVMSRVQTLQTTLSAITEAMHEQQTLSTILPEVIEVRNAMETSLNELRLKMGPALTSLEQRVSSTTTQLLSLMVTLVESTVTSITPNKGTLTALKSKIMEIRGQFKNLLVTMKTLSREVESYESVPHSVEILSDSLEEVPVPEKTFAVVNLHDDTFAMPPPVQSRQKSTAFVISPPSSRTRQALHKEIKKEKVAKGESSAHKGTGRPSTSAVAKVEPDATRVTRQKWNECDGLKGSLEEMKRGMQKEREEFEKSKAATRQKYEKQLEQMKRDMKQLYSQEVGKHKQEIAKQLEEHEKSEKELKEQNRMYKEHIDELRSQVWELGEKLLLEQNTKKELESRQSELSRQLDRFTLPPPEWRSLSVDSRGATEDNSTTSSATSFRPPPTSFFPAMRVEDEEEVFDNQCLEELKSGQMKEEDPARRLTELQVRNSLCLPHLKSSYPAETQFLNPQQFTENDLRIGTLNFACESQSATDSSGDPSMTRSLLPVEKGKKKEQTSYKKPGPPTPSKLGRLSLGGEQRTPKRALREQNTCEKGRGTPNRLKALFTSKVTKRQSLGGALRPSLGGVFDENTAPTTPRSKGLRIFQRKPFGGREF